MLVFVAGKNPNIKYINLCKSLVYLFINNLCEVGNVYISAATKENLLRQKRAGLEMYI